jgi:hypothetical protein
MQLQEYDLKIEHIKGTENFFADALSRNPIGLSQESRDMVMKPRELCVAKLDLGTDKKLMKELSNLLEHQLGDPVLTKIREELERDPIKLKDKYMIRDNVLYCKDDRAYLYWRAMLPNKLEYRVIQYVHTLLGHQGTDKCMLQISQTFHLKSLGSAKVRGALRHLSTC